MTSVIGITLLNNTLSASPLSSLSWELSDEFIALSEFAQKFIVL